MAKNGGRVEDTSGRKGEEVSSEALGIIDIKDEVKKLQLEIEKLSGMASSNRPHRPLSTASLNNLSADRKARAPAPEN